MPGTYHKNGLRYLKRIEPTEYDKCVTAFGEAIRKAWQKHPAIPALANVPAFTDIPNQFAGGQWEEAAGPVGWLPGPGVANFVFAAAINKQLQKPTGRYGASAAEWRPYLPPVAKTVSEIAKEAAKKHCLRYREIVVNDKLVAELQGARDRKNLTLVLADAQTLPIDQYQPVATFDTETWD